MMVSAVYFGAMFAAALATPSSNTILAIIAVVGGIAAWRSRRGDFYKAVAEEKSAETDSLRADNAKLRQATDITPILKSQEAITAALNRHAETSQQLIAKVADMNGSLRAHGQAMKALADRLVIDEAARALLETAAQRPEKPVQRRHT